MENSNSLGGARIALLIDFDNVILGIDEPGFDIELVVNALRERGTITVSRVYGDWYRHSRHRRRLMEHGVELVEAPAFGPVIKNSADIKIALDGYEIGMTMPHINTFCLVSGDSDFLPLIKKLQGLGKNVLVICGNRFTSDMLRRNCNEFISYENLLAASYGADEDATTLEGAFALLHRAMAALRERGSEIRTSTLKQMMIQLNPVFSEKTFGYNQFRGFLDKAGREHLIKLGPRDRVSGEFYVLLPEEDEAEVIEKVERAESAEVVEEIVEARRGNGRNRRRDDKTKDERKERRETSAPDEETQRPRSRREARLLAHREQTAADQQTATSPNAASSGAAPLATPLTPATDFSPADARETSEMSVSRNELLARGLRVGKFKFSGARGVEKIEAPTENREETPVEADIALTPDDAQIEAETPGAEASEVTAPEVTPNETPSAGEEKPKRSRSRRRKKSATPESETATAQNESAPENEAPTDAVSSADAEAGAAASAPESAAQTANIADETEIAEAKTEIDEAKASAETAPAETKPKRRTRSRAKAKTVETPAEPEIAEQAASAESAPVENKESAPAPEKPKRTRRRKKTETTEENTEMKETEKAIQADGTEQTVSKQALIEASADTPAATAEAQPKTKRRRTSRKNAEEKAEAQANVSENIVTGDQTTDEVSPAQLAQIPVPVSEDEL